MVHAEPEERNDADEVHALDHREPATMPIARGFAARRKGEHRGHEKERGLDSVAAVLDVHGEDARLDHRPDDRVCSPIAGRIPADTLTRKAVNGTTTASFTGLIATSA